MAATPIDPPVTRVDVHAGPTPLAWLLSPEGILQVWVGEQATSAPSKAVRCDIAPGHRTWTLFAGPGPFWCSACGETQVPDRGAACRRCRERA